MKSEIFKKGEYFSYKMSIPITKIKNDCRKLLVRQMKDFNIILTLNQSRYGETNDPPNFQNSSKNYFRSIPNNKV